jgi:hypothetical protein
MRRRSAPAPALQPKYQIVAELDRDTRLFASGRGGDLQNVNAFKCTRNRRGTGYRLLLAVKRLKAAAGRSRGRERKR